MAERGLGRGLSALFGEEATAGMESGAALLPIQKIEPNSAQPRREFDPEALKELAESIALHGVITPIAVRRLSGGGYQIIAGERRWRAARMAGLTEMPAVVLEADDKRMLELGLIENLQREDLNPLEEAMGFRTLLDDFGMTQEKVAERVGRSRPAVANALRLLSLPEGVKALVQEGRLSGGHARALLPLGDEEKMTEMARRVVSGGYSVRQTEQSVKRALSEKPAPKKQAPELQVDYTGELERRLAAKLGRRVSISHGEKKGRIELEYYGIDDLDRLIRLLEAGSGQN